MRSNREGHPTNFVWGPRDMTGNVQLYLTEAGLSLPRMAGPLGGFGLGVKLGRE
jgi:hypothetical protein